MFILCKLDANLMFILLYGFAKKALSEIKGMTYPNEQSKFWIQESSQHCH